MGFETKFSSSAEASAYLVEIRSGIVEQEDCVEWGRKLPVFLVFDALVITFLSNLTQATAILNESDTQMMLPTIKTIAGYVERLRQDLGQVKEDIADRELDDPFMARAASITMAQNFCDQWAFIKSVKGKGGRKLNLFGGAVGVVVK